MPDRPDKPLYGEKKSRPFIDALLHRLKHGRPSLKVEVEHEGGALWLIGIALFLIALRFDDLVDAVAKIAGGA